MKRFGCLTANTLPQHTVFKNMERLKIYIIVGVLFLVPFSPLPSAAQTGPGGSPISSIPPSALPPSARQEGLIQSPNPIDRSSNLTVTGNIRGGKYFHDSVPYRDSTSFGQTLPSSSLDSFIRDSAGTEDIGRFTEGKKPYYSPTQTVTTVSPGSSVVIRPPTTNIGSYVTQSPAFGASAQRTDTTPDTGYVTPLISQRPMSKTLQELEKQISSEIDTQPETEELTGQQYQILAEKFQKTMAQQLSNKAPELRKSLTINDSPLLPPTERKPPEDTPKEKTAPPEKLLDEDEASSESDGLWIPEKQEDDEQPQGYGQTRQPLDKPPQGYEQVKQQLDDLNKRIDRALFREITEEEDEDTADSPSGIRDAATNGTYQTPQYNLQYDLYAPRVDEIDPAITTKAKEILGPHTAASFSESNFNKNMAAAERYLRLGRYYRAVDAYSLALVYKRDDPIAYAGKSYALFASGEYMSSALFLSRILQMFPEYAQLKVDIETMTGGSENLQARVAEAEEWLGRSDAPELHFLLAYVYYQMNEIGLAQKAIDAAYEKAPDAPAVQTLKKTIEDSI